MLSLNTEVDCRGLFWYAHIESTTGSYSHIMLTSTLTADLGKNVNSGYSGKITLTARMSNRELAVQV